MTPLSTLESPPSAAARAAVLLLAASRIPALALAAIAASGDATALSAFQAPDAQALCGSCVEVHTTAMGTELRLALTDRVALLPARQSPETDIAVFVNPAITHQELLGLGGAITDASAEVFARLDAATQERLLSAYFDPVEGLGYSMIRTPIHSSDFASASHTYIEEGDAELATFDVAPDRRYRIPMIRRAIEAAGGSLTTMASPWSAPAFMKDNGSMLQGGRLLPRYRDAWARYTARFIEEYEEAGIPIWGVSVQNEPLATQTWESMLYTAEEERDFLKNHLGPTLRDAGLGDKKIVVWDHNRDLLPHRAHTILGDPEAAQFVWGVGFHWYETWAGGEPMYGNVADVDAAYPEVKVLLTEACVEGFDAARTQDWANAERYGDAIVNDLNAGAVAWLDWNILLDETGGPNHVGNLCFAPIHADLGSGELIFTPSYWYLGHFSRFIRPGAQRLSATSTRSSLQATSWRNPDGSMATVVLNLGDEPVRYRFATGEAEATTVIPPRAIQTLVTPAEPATGWITDFRDDFDTFDPSNWQDQRIWVNNEKQCYVPDNAHGTREVSNGTLKLKVVRLDEPCPCDNLDKFGAPHPPTPYVAGRICSKNRQEFVKGRWTARLRVWGEGQPSMFPAWWLLGNRNNEAPVQEADEDVPWPLEGSGEIDIFEHHGDYGAGHFTTGAIKNLGNNEGDWWTLRTDVDARLGEWHEYSVEWAGSDLVYRVDGREVHRNEGEGDKYPEAMFAILNFAKITDAPMEGEWVMEVDWVEHAAWDASVPFPDPRTPQGLELSESEGGTTLTWEGAPGLRYSVQRAERPDEAGVRIAFQLEEPRFVDEAPPAGRAWYYTVSASAGCQESAPSAVVHTRIPAVALPARLEAEHYAKMDGAATEACGDEGGGLNLGFFDPGDSLEYRITVPEEGLFVLDYRLASQYGSEGFAVLVDGAPLDRQAVASTGAWQTYATQSSEPVRLAAGEHTLRFESIGSQWNLNWFEVRRAER
jgi:glucosylceramidase